MSIATPEGVDLDLVLAGVGSRFTAGLLDGALRLVIILAAALMTGLSGARPGVAVAIGVGAVFLALFAYDVLFEVFGAGRTPGKRWTGLRVVNDTGDAVGIGASVVRNLLRIIDAIPGIYLVGILTVAFTKRHQRVGDLIAGTLVVRERRGTTSVPLVPAHVEEVVAAELDGWDVSAVTPDEIAAVRRFLERRTTLQRDARERIGRDLASRLRPKVLAPERLGNAESFLEQLVAVKSYRASR